MIRFMLSTFAIAVTAPFLVLGETGDSLGKECKENAINELESGGSIATINEELVRCIRSKYHLLQANVDELLEFHVDKRKSEAELFESYTCTDDSLGTTEGISTDTWQDPASRKHYNVTIFLDRPSAKVQMIENFISEQECHLIEEKAKNIMSTATTFDGKGGIAHSTNRKAKQGSFTVPWENATSPITMLGKRILNYTNDVINLNLTEHGQEWLNSIQYEGGKKEPDQYLPHCDGDCRGRKHMVGTRVATMVMYCTIPESGGGTNFRQIGVHIKPRAGNAIFFSYFDPETKMMDNFLTEHSGCPVLKGEKKIVTQWLRLGVTSDVPWQAYDTNGHRLPQDILDAGLLLSKLNLEHFKDVAVVESRG